MDNDFKASNLRFSSASIHRFVCDKRLMKTKFLVLCLAVLGLSGFGVAQAVVSKPAVARVNAFLVVADRRYSHERRYGRHYYGYYHHRRHYRSVRRVYYRHGRRVVVIRRVYY